MNVFTKLLSDMHLGPDFPLKLSVDAVCKNANVFLSQLLQVFF